tara:strand:+ start:16782 stop:16949 length:168 start_codon:yes stop_codon:yes gene_type:complete
MLACPVLLRAMVGICLTRGHGVKAFQHARQFIGALVIMVNDPPDMPLSLSLNRPT